MSAPLKRYEVEVEVSDVRVYRHIVLAHNRDEAGDIATEWYPEHKTSGPRVVRRDDDGESIDSRDEVTEVTLIEPNGDHAVSLLGLGDGKATCMLCGEPVTWTGTSDTKTGACITPGPWVHTINLKENA